MPPQVLQQALAIKVFQVPLRVPIYLCCHPLHLLLVHGQLRQHNCHHCHRHNRYLCPQQLISITSVISIVVIIIGTPTPTLLKDTFPINPD